MELMAVIAVIMVSFAIAVPLLLRSGAADRDNLTRQRLQNIKQAITGNPEIMVNKVRADFGFAGDLGQPPADLLELLVRGSYPQFTTQNQVSFGWRGPYLQTAMENGDYVALLDAWGRGLAYRAGAGSVLREIRSAGADGIFDNDDDLVIQVYHNEVSQYLSGSFLSRVSKNLLTDYHGRLNVYFPAGTAGLVQSQIEVVGGLYDSLPLNLRLPVGHRFLQTEDGRYARLATLNGGSENSGAAVTVDFIGEEESAPGETFELTFDDSDDASMLYTALRGSWSASGGNLAPTGAGEHRLVFEHGEGNDYRVTVNATLLSGRGYGIYYRSNGQADISAYCFQYDPGLYAGGGSQGISFVVRRVFNGSEQAPFQRIDRSSAQFPGIYGQSHQVSITVQADRHIIKLDGSEIFNFSDNTFTSGRAGLRSWDGQGTTLFHHVLIHPVPPLASGEIAWWSFEEGNGAVAYGSGFVPGVAENNGLISNLGRVSRGIFGTALSGGGAGRVTIPNAPVLNPGSLFSIEAWVRPATNQQTADLVFKGQQNNRGQGIYQNISNSPTNGGWNAQVQTSGGIVNLCWGERRPDADTWYHLVLAVNGSEALFYVDGVEKDRAVLPGDVLWSGDDLWLADGFRGLIDEIYFFRRELSPAQVLERFNRRKDNRW